MTSVTLPNSGGTVSLEYDPFGRRIEKISPNATSIFVYDGESLTQTVNTSGSTIARYVQGQDIDEALALQRGTTTDYFEADGLASVTSLSSSTGTIAQTYTYDSFGNTTNSTGSLTNYFRYSSREFDTGTGLYDFRARYYDPTVGRFLSEDPLEFDGGISFYAYTANDPVTLVDPSGMAPGPGDDDSFTADRNDPVLSPLMHQPWPSSGRFFGVGTGPHGWQQCVALTRHFAKHLPCSDCWRKGPKVIGNTIPQGTAIATFNKNGHYPKSGNANSGIYVGTYPGNQIIIVDQWPPNIRQPMALQSRLGRAHYFQPRGIRQMTRVDTS